MRLKISSAITKIKNKQHFLFWTALVVIWSILIVLVIALAGKNPEVKKPTSYRASLSTGTSRLDKKEVWAEKFSSELDKQSQIIKNQNDQITKLHDSLLAISKLLTGKSEQEKGLEKNIPADEVEQLRQHTAISQPEPNQNPFKGTATYPDELKALPKAKELPFRSKGITRTIVSLTNAKGGKPLKTFDNTIPAGAFARTVMVGGVDASTSIQANNDPRPVLLRIVDAGTLPRKFKSDLQGCHVLAACYGDISSERVYMRLEKLTCTERKTGEVVEMAINGYVAGEDGRAGLRGVVVDRAGETMRNAAVGGFLSGIGQFLSQSHNSPFTFASNGLAQNPMTNPEMLKHGAARGASSALEKYADFYIKRAEQMQPVIQVQAGRVVDIVFTQGTAFESSASRDSLVKVNDQQRLSQLQVGLSTKPVEAWIPNQPHQE